MLKLKKYCGDRSFADTLKNNGIAVSTGFIRAAILGAQSASEPLGISDVLREIASSGSTTRLSTECVEAVEGLWYYCYGISKFPEAEYNRLDPADAGRETIRTHVVALIEAGDEFLKYLHFGKTDRYFGREKLKKLYATFFSNLEVLRALLHGVTEKWGEEEFSNIESFVEKLNRFTVVFWDLMVAIKEEVKAAKLETMKNKTIIHKIESETKQQIRRNDPCPCGSGKKYKMCCGVA